MISVGLTLWSTQGRDDVFPHSGVAWLAMVMIT